MTPPTDYRADWKAPLLLGKRLCWSDETGNRSIPIVSWVPIYTAADKADPNEWGFIADLPTENAAVVSVIYDPTEGGVGADKVSMFLYVRHPETGHLIDAKVRDGRIVYDSDCLGERCGGCEHGFGQWWEYVHSAIEVMAKLGYLGSLPVATR